MTSCDVINILAITAIPKGYTQNRHRDLINMQIVTYLVFIIMHASRYTYTKFVKRTVPGVMVRWIGLYSAQERQ